MQIEDMGCLLWENGQFSALQRRLSDIIACRVMVVVDLQFLNEGESMQ